MGVPGDVCCRNVQHFAGRGAVWTRRFQHLVVLEIVEGDNAMADAKTIQHRMQLWPHWDLVRGGCGCEEALRLPPLPIPHTQTISQPKPLVERSWETMHDHLLSVIKHSETGPHAFKAHISGRKASEACFVRGVKTICAETKEDVRSRAAEWIGQYEVVDGHFFLSGIEPDD